MLDNITTNVGKFEKGYSKNILILVKLTHFTTINKKKIGDRISIHMSGIHAKMTPRLHRSVRNTKITKSEKKKEKKWTYLVGVNGICHSIGLTPIVIDLSWNLLFLASQSSFNLKIAILLLKPPIPKLSKKEGRKRRKIKVDFDIFTS